MKPLPWLLAVFACVCLRGADSAGSLGEAPWVTFSRSEGAVALFQAGDRLQVWADPESPLGVARAATDVVADLGRVTGASASFSESFPQGKFAVIVGVLGHCRILDRLVAEGRITTAAIAGRWEAFQWQVVEQPAPGLDRALIICGSDRRGAIYGAYELSEQIGVSPWYWWADVPVMHRNELWVKREPLVERGPAVRYRGIFLNDEAPALSGWTAEKFGGYNSRFYRHVFELLLRLRGNYLWPAMWHAAFNEDDPENARLANEYGIVMGTSHHEPMMRAHEEWKRHGTGAWDFSRNAETLKAFWTGGIQGTRAYDKIITLGMRGNGDEPMSAEANVALLENIVETQREIIARETGAPVESVPQLWALYKEVQEYYEKGMRVPDDITLLWCDDNWGNIRRLPTAEERKRAGGAGVYYHFDYVGGPRNYKWINTNPIPKVQEQMSRAADAGADRIWIVNVGDLKPMEFPTEFFLRLAWEPKRWGHDDLDDYTLAWANREFGSSMGREVADLVAKGAFLNGRRKPELIDGDTYSILNYREAERVVADYAAAESQARSLSERLQADARPAFYQLVQHPIEAGGNLVALHVAAAKNRLYARQGRNSTLAWAELAEDLFRRDAKITETYNRELSGGKWNHFMDQTHLGYTYWQQPPVNVRPPLVSIQLPDTQTVHVALASGVVLDAGRSNTRLETASDRGSAPRFEVFFRGRGEAVAAVRSETSWLRAVVEAGARGGDLAVRLEIDWESLPEGMSDGSLWVESAVGRIALTLPVHKGVGAGAGPGAFIEEGGYVAIDAAHFSNHSSGAGVSWEVLPGYGRNGSAIGTFPIGAPSNALEAGAEVSYPFWRTSAGDVIVHLQLGTSLPVSPGAKMRVAVAIDDGDFILLDSQDDPSLRAWEKAVADSIVTRSARVSSVASGAHTVRLRRIDPGVMVERIIIDCGGLKPSYLGPLESPRIPTH